MAQGARRGRPRRGLRGRRRRRAAPGRRGARRRLPRRGRGARARGGAARRRPLRRARREPPPRRGGARLARRARGAARARARPRRARHRRAHAGRGRRVDPGPDHRRARAATRPRSSAHAHCAWALRPSRARAGRGRLDAASAGPSSCCPTGTRRCSTTCSARRAPARSTSCSACSAARRTTCAATVDLRGADVVVNREFGTGCSSSIATALRPLDPRIDVLVLLLGDQPGVRPETVARAARRPRRRAARGVSLRGRARAPAGVRAQHVRRPRDAARRQGRLAAHGPRSDVAEVVVPGAVPRDVDTRGLRAVLAERVTGARIAAPRRPIRDAVPDVETLVEGLAGVDYLADEGLATALFFALRLPQPLLLEGEAGRRQDRGGQVAGRVPRHAADPPAVLRGHRRGRGALRVELPPPAAADPHRGGGGRRDRRGATSSRPSTSSRGRCCRRSSTPARCPRCSSSTSSTARTTTSRRSSSSCWPRRAITIPELGTVRATHPPLVVLTSNRTRDLHDALKRRCLYHWIDYPDAEREVEIVRRRVPEAAPGRSRSTSPRRCAGCAGTTCRSRRASPRRSTGSRRSSCSASTGSTRPPRTARSARC